MSKISKMKTTGLMFGVAMATAAFLSCGAANAGSAAAVGDWYGRGQPGGDSITVYLDHIKADGTFVAEFERCVGKKGGDVIESGTWSASQDILRVNTRVANGKPLVFQTDYANISNDGKTWVYRIVASEPESPDSIGYQFTARRVSSDFHLPGCMQIS
jgi:ABC-type glycerol-3-phosphate transport system substrate-binding protein